MKGLVLGTAVPGVASELVVRPRAEIPYFTDGRCGRAVHLAISLNGVRDTCYPQGKYTYDPFKKQWTCVIDGGESVVGGFVTVWNGISRASVALADRYRVKVTLTMIEETWGEGSGNWCHWCQYIKVCFDGFAPIYKPEAFVAIFIRRYAKLIGRLNED